jgi:hypothetical protein
VEVGHLLSLRQVSVVVDVGDDPLTSYYAATKH